MAKTIGRSTFATSATFARSARPWSLAAAAAIGATFATWLGACSGGRSGAPTPPPDPGVTVTPTPPATEQVERAQVAAALAAVSGLDAAGVRSRFPAGFTTALGYDPSAAANLPLIQASPLALNSAESAILKKNGFGFSTIGEAMSAAWAATRLHLTGKPPNRRGIATLLTVPAAPSQMPKEFPVSRARRARTMGTYCLRCFGSE